MASELKVKVVVLESRLHDNACSTDFTFPLARWVPMQPATIDPTLDLCTRYPLRLGGPRQYGMQSLPDTSTHGQHRESNPRPSDLESNALSTRPHAPTNIYLFNFLKNVSNKPPQNNRPQTSKQVLSLEFTQIIFGLCAIVSTILTRSRHNKARGSQDGCRAWLHNT